MGPTENPAPRTLYGLAPETDWIPDWCCVGQWTTARQDFSHPGVVWNSSKIEQKGGWGAVALQEGFWHYITEINVKTSLFDPVYYVQKICKTFLKE
jgi:hypothetical protein